jgi:hypothetical protein
MDTFLLNNIFQPFVTARATSISAAAAKLMVADIVLFVLSGAVLIDGFSAIMFLAFLLYAWVARRIYRIIRESISDIIAAERAAMSGHRNPLRFLWVLRRFIALVSFAVGAPLLEYLTGMTARNPLSAALFIASYAAGTAALYVGSCDPPRRAPIPENNPLLSAHEAV